MPIGGLLQDFGELHGEFDAFTELAAFAGVSTGFTHFLDLPQEQVEMVRQQLVPKGGVLARPRQVAVGSDASLTHWVQTIGA